jgi:hypothetical protein
MAGFMARRRPALGAPLPPNEIGELPDGSEPVIQQFLGILKKLGEVPNCQPG